MDCRRLQVLVLRLIGTVELLAFGAAVMPFAWMEAGHAWLGVGELPKGPVIESLLRQVSFTYGLHGVALWLIASDVVRYRPFVVLTGIGYLVTGPVFVMIDLAVGMPWFWVLGNGGACLGVGALVLGLLWGEGKTGADALAVHAQAPPSVLAE
jgi:hypothetical protein